MSNLVLHREQSQAIALPEPRCGEILIRPATLDDVPFIDQLQRKHARMVGWFPTKQIEGNIAKGKVLIAEEVPGGSPSLAERGPGGGSNLPNDGGCNVVDGLTHPPTPSLKGGGVLVGYCISTDKYLKREELGIVYQLNVLPGKQRGLIGASLIKAVFDRAAYGCKLFCCWCAQDLQANHFWESIGFVPLAFRTGSRTAGSKKTPRIHIFWQRRIRENDVETPYWFPSETSAGAIGEARLVLPIPPGTSWQDAKPAVLPGMENVNVLPPGVSDPTVKEQRKKAKAARAAAAKPAARPATAHPGGLWFAPPTPVLTQEEIEAEKKLEKPKREKFKHDPKMVEAARELRDRYTEQMNAGLFLPPSACGKYDVSRQLEAAPSAMKMEGAAAARLLDAA